MKIGIITYSESLNWGAQLQAYALRKAFEDNGAEAFQINHRALQCSLYRKGYSPSIIVNNIISFLTKKELNRRIERTIQWRNKRLSLTEPKYSLCEMKALSNEFDVFVTGSDQVWNCAKGLNSNFYLSFVEDNSKKCSYAASFGISKLPESYTERVTKELSNYRYITTREISGQKILKDVCGISAESVCDPVMLLTKESWSYVIDEDSKANISNKGNYIFVYSTQMSRDFISTVKKVQRKCKLPIVSVSYIPGCKLLKDVGPAEFVDYIRNAACVVTTSFHACVFSILFEKNFCVLPHKSTGSRVTDLLSRLELDTQIIDNDFDGNISIPQYEVVSKKVDLFRQKSLTHIVNIIDGKKNVKKESNTIRVVGNACTGCRVCEQVCPFHCISFEKNKEGFIYPLIDQDKCIRCGKCLSNCHIANPNDNFEGGNDGVYGYAKSQSLRKEGSSGGAFGAIVNMLGDNSDNLSVYGSIFDSSNNTIYQKGYVYPNYKKLCQSKYVFSDPLNTFSEVKELLVSQKDVVYCGTPCQIGALKKYLVNEYDNLLTMDFICHGVPSEDFITKHLDVIARRKKIRNVEFRSKAHGWGLHKHCLKVLDDNKKIVYLKKAGKDFFFTHFLANDCLRMGCYQCKYSKKHCSDITLGDFWEVGRYDKEWNDNKGVSVIFSNTEKGRKCIRNLSEYMELKPIPKEYVRSHCGCSPLLLSERESFMQKYQNNSLDKLEQIFRIRRPIILARKFTKKLVHR